MFRLMLAIAMCLLFLLLVICPNPYLFRWSLLIDIIIIIMTV